MKLNLLQHLSAKLSIWHRGIIENRVKLVTTLMKWWDLSEEKLREAQSLIAQKDIQLFIRWYKTKELTPPNCKSLN
jgi:hypothetical protein